MKKIFALLAVFCLGVLAQCSRGEEKHAGADNIGLYVINILDKPFYQDAHIKGSIHVPFMDLSEYAGKLDRNAEIVVYCSNYACSASGAAAQQLLDMGFTKVWAYEGGIAEWYQLNFPVEGPAEKEYLKAENEKLATETTVPEISSQDLKNKMEQYKLL